MMRLSELRERVDQALARHATSVAEANLALREDMIRLIEVVAIDQIESQPGENIVKLVRDALVPRGPVGRVIDATAKLTGYPVEALTGQSRIGDLTFARQIAMAVAAERTTASRPMIGKLFGGRDHSTVIHAIRTVQERMTPEVRELMDLIAAHAGLPARKAA